MREEKGNLTKIKQRKRKRQKKIFLIEIHSANPNSNKINEKMEGVSKDNN